MAQQYKPQLEVEILLTRNVTASVNSAPRHPDTIYLASSPHGCWDLFWPQGGGGLAKNFIAGGRTVEMG